MDQGVIVYLEKTAGGIEASLIRPDPRVKPELIAVKVTELPVEISWEQAQVMAGALWKKATLLWER